jgi:hypothetical protein
MRGKIRKSVHEAVAARPRKFVREAVWAQGPVPLPEPCVVLSQGCVWMFVSVRQRLK